LAQLDKLKSAIKFFESNEKQSDKKENELVWSQGKQNVDREFDQFMKKFSEATLDFILKDIYDPNIAIDRNDLNFKGFYFFLLLLF